MEFVSVIIYISIYLGLVATSFYALSYVSNKNKKKLLFTDDELPKVSVLIPAYNEEKSIARTIESILATDYPEKKLEVIVIDDGSRDNTLKIAKKFERKFTHSGGPCGRIVLKVFTKPNGGKGTALNLGIKKARGEIIFSMDADTFVEPHSVKEMVRYFKDGQVMSVTPAMVIYKPKSILQRIQQAEYLFGIFLRKAFSSINAVYISPGAFSAYRKSFFDKYGGYDENNITEDLEMSLRIQFKGYKIENSPDSPAYTIAPKRFFPLLKQRRRWYAGLMRNTWKYKRIISPKYGDLGMFVIPVAWISILFSVFTIIYLSIKTLFRVKNELLFLSSINFDFFNVFNLNFYIIERFFFFLFSNPIVIFLLFFMCILGFYLFYATRKLGKASGIAISIPLFFIFFAVLFGFWWVVSIIYVLLNRKVSWR